MSKFWRVTVPYWITPQMPDPANAIEFDFADWTPWGPTALTMTVLQIFNGVFNPPQNQIPVHWARIAIAVSSPSFSLVQARCSVGKSVNGEQVWEPFGAEMSNAANMSGVPLLETIVTNQFNALNGLSFRSIRPELKGHGRLHGAKLDVIYKFPDYTDEIASLMQRVEALEQQ